jgi:hypothetical protein
VPSLDGLAAATGATTGDTATPETPTPGTAAPATPAASTPDRTDTRSRQGPPVLRVVPPADPEPPSDAADGADDAHEQGRPAEARPTRRAVGARGGRDWADVLMGGGPAAGPRQD